MFRSIRAKLTLSYIIVIIVSLAITGLFFQFRIINRLESNISNELFDRASITAGTMSSLMTKHEDFFELAENISEQYAGDRDKKIEIYSPKGFLIADSVEPGFGKLEAPDETLDIILGKDSDFNDIHIHWENEITKDRKVFHTTISLFDFDGEFLGAVDTSIAKENNVQTLEDEIVQKMHHTGEQVANDLFFTSYDQWEDTAGKFTARFSEDASYRVRIYNRNLDIIASSQNLDSTRNNRLFEGEKVKWIRKEKSERFMNAAVPVPDKNTKFPAGSVVLSTSLADVDNTYLEVRRVFAFAIGLSMFVTAIISMFLAFNLVKPIIHIKDVASGIAAGNFNSRADYNGSDEFHSLSETINFMAACIQSNIREITDEKDKMNALLGALPDGVIALAYSGEVRFVNESSARFLTVEPADATAKTLFELWPDVQIREFFEEGREENSLFTKEISIPPRHLRLYLIPYGEQDKSGMMMIIRDVTDLRRLEETRTRFLGSVSHELRTPLTVIKGFVHSINDEKEVQENEEIRHALEVIDRETDRLTRLVNDLLELSRLRSKRLSIEMDQITPDEIVKETITQLLPNAERMTISMTQSINGEKTNLRADKDRLKQVIINIVDNAIKYTPTGGSVAINTSKDDNFWILEVKDTGTGIPKNEIPFLFEKFFRTKDKNKKKHISGTGLGMAIVKEIVDAHKGKIDVESEEGKGTRISVYFPLAAECVKIEESVPADS
jgi:two-component system, OmpR family, phosphate regulon sensor histidine kinase PhoR